MILATVLAWTASVVFLSRLVPQPIRILRTGHVAGVSALAAMNAFVTDVAWLSYGLAAGVTAVWVVSIPAMLVSGVSAWLLRRTVRPADIAIAGGWGVFVAVSAAAGFLTAVLGVAVLVTCGPSLWTAYTDRCPTGLSAATWWIALLDAATWGGYGLVIHDGALKLYAVVLVLTAVAILLRLAWVRRRLLATVA